MTVFRSIVVIAKYQEITGSRVIRAPINGSTQCSFSLDLLSDVSKSFVVVS